MKNLVIFMILSCLPFSYTYSQTESVQNSPFEFGASYIGDAVSNLKGGAKTGSCYLGAANIKVGFDTERAKLWRGGAFYVNGANTHGGMPSATLIGDFQGVSNIEAGNVTYLYEMWFKQSLGNLTTTIGLQDLNSEFITSESATLFLNGSFGTHSTISNNIGAPIFPLTSLGIEFKYQFNDCVDAKFALFDGLPDDYNSNPNNLKWSFRSKDGILTFSEINFNNLLNTQLSNNYKIGLYTHNCLSSNELMGDSTRNCNKYGIYFVGDQTLIESKQGSELSLFTQLSFTPYKDEVNYYYIGAGINYSNLINGGIMDILGVSIAHAGLKTNESRSETTLELTYKMEIYEHIFIQPDFQYIINPSGNEMALSNASVVILRFGFNF